MPVNVTDESFEKEVLKSDKPVIVDFWAEWCGPCRILGPRFEELSREMPDVKFCKFNVDENQETAGSFGIMSIPTLLIFRKGQLADRVIGALPKESLRKKIEQAVNG